MPTYPDIRLAIASLGARSAGASRRPPPDHIHIATEGPIGWLTRRDCLQAQADLHHQLSHPVSRIYLGADRRSGMARPMRAALFSRAFGRGDGADADHRRRPHPARLRPGPAVDARRQPRAVPPAGQARARPAAADLPVGRPGGGGKEPRGAARASTCRARPSSSATGRRAPRSSAATRTRIFSAHKQGEALADIYASADVFVFPSRTDTFGIVLIEAMASGLPVAAFPVARPDRRRRARARACSTRICARPASRR